MMLNARTDANQPFVVDKLRRAGYHVLLLHRVGCGCPDLLVTSKRGVHCLMEIKVPGEKLNQREAAFFETHPGPKYIVHSPEEALSVMRDFDGWGLELMEA